MRTDNGFTIVEMLTALLIIALATAAVGDLFSIISKSWTETSSDLELIITLSESATYTANFYSIDEKYPSIILEGDIILDNGQTFSRNQIKIDAKYDCTYDLVGKRCR